MIVRKRTPPVEIVQSAVAGALCRRTPNSLWLIGRSIKINRSTTTTAADQRLLINAVTLIALGFSVLFLNSWDNLFVRTTVGLFWGTYFLILNGPDLMSVFRKFRSKNEL